MAIAVVLDFDGATLEQYDEVNAKLGFEPFGKARPGCLFHWVTATASGVRIVDVWESKEQFEKFGEEQIGPTAQAAGVPNAAQMQFLDVHNYQTGA